MKNIIVFIGIAFCLSKISLGQQSGGSVDSLQLNLSKERDVEAVLIVPEMKNAIIKGLEKGSVMGRDLSIFTFDYESKAMHVSQVAKNVKLNISKKLDDFNEGKQLFIYLNHGFYMKENFDYRPMYFDHEGYVYTTGKGSKGQWIKTQLTTLYKMMGSTNSFAINMPEPFSTIVLKESKYNYYGIDVSPGLYPILEWAFRYKVQHFESSPDFAHEFVDFAGEAGSSKYTLKTGKEKGSFVIFDGFGRLREINTINSGMIQYTYGEFTVKLPDPDKVRYFSDELFMPKMMENIKKNN